MEKKIKTLSVKEQEEIVGGINWGCFASGGLIALGVASGQPELVGTGIFGAYANC